MLDRVEIGMLGATYAPRFGIECELTAQQMVSRLDVADEPLGPARRPFHRAAESAGRPRERHILRVHLDLRAEAAADVAGDAPYAVGRDAEDAREVRRQLMDALKPRVEGVAAGAGIPLGERRA